MFTQSIVQLSVFRLALLAIAVLGIAIASAFAAGRIFAGGEDGYDESLVYSACSSKWNLRLVDGPGECRQNENFVQIDLNEAKGQDGQAGINCWDLNADRVNDPEEDVNNDGAINVYDCRVTAAPTSTPQPTATSTPGQGPVTPPNPGTPSGTAVIAVDAVNKENGLNAAQPTDANHYWGISEMLFLRGDDDTSLPWLATGFEIKSDLSGALLFIRDGVPFQDNKGDFGELTAHDVAWSMNNANAATNPGSNHGQAGDFAGLWGEWTAITDTVIEFDFTFFNSTWKDDLLNQSGQGLTITSKRAFDEMGAEFVRDNIVATGPYEVESWDANQQVTIVSRYANGGQHYLPELTPETERIQFIEVADSWTRSALLRNGQVDAAPLNPKDAIPFIQGGFGETGAAGGVQLGVFFSGNLWEETSAQDGSELQRLTYVHDLAWIGNPDGHDGGLPFDDMEQARLVRRALAIAIDRDEVNQDLLGGLGKPVHVEYFSTSHPLWDSKWEYPYDPQEARRILSQDIEGDYQRGSADTSDDNLNGNAFEVSVYAGPELGGGSQITGEVADAVAGYWAELGLTTFSLKYSYQVFRPTVVGRTNTIPWITSCDKGRENYPWHFPKGLVETSLTRGGFGCGLESPEILEFYQRMAVASDQATATQAATEYLEYVYYWNLQPGVVVVPNDVYFNPNKIVAWPMAKSMTSPIDSVWDLQLE